MTRTADEIRRRLCEPFAVREVKWKPQAVKGNRAMAAAYIDARLVMDRLDEVVGVENWQDSYEVLNDGCVVCRLAVRLAEGGEWVTKTDVGDPSEQPDAGDRLKAAFCLPLDAMALTLDGWTSYDRVRVGDLILGYDIASGECRWTPVSAVNVFDRPTDLWSLNSKSFNATCTPNHGWVVHRRGRGVSVKETRLLDSYDRIVVAAPAEGGQHQLTAKEAAVLGWLATDGGVHIDPSRRLFNAFIHQSKIATRDSIRALLGSDATEHITPAGERTFPGRAVPSAVLERSAFRLKSPVAKRLLSRAGLYDGVGVQWGKLAGLITRLSKDARAALFTTMMEGDGQRAASGQLKFGKKRKPGVMEAFEILATMEGVALGTLHGSSQDGHIPVRTLRVNPHTWNKCIEVTHAVPEAVWCPTTGTGTWVTMWSGQITITGNSDAIKRAAVKFGIGRYLYRLPSQWADYDPQKRQFVGTPALPAWAIPAAGGRQPPKGGSGTAPAVGAAVGGAELHARIREKDGKLAAAGRAKAGELVTFVAGRGGKAGYGNDIGRWPAEAFQFAIAVVKEFEAAHPVPAGPGGGHHQHRPEGE